MTAKEPARRRRYERRMRRPREIRAGRKLHAVGQRYNHKGKGNGYVGSISRLNNFFGAVWQGRAC